MIKLKRRCKCGCGDIANPGNKWIWGHHTRNFKVKSNPNYKHGLAGHKLYMVWKAMKQRCYNPNITCYQDYGGRGIKISIRWRNNFMRFYNWAISHGWKKGLQIDREDNNGNYHPNNCRFVTPKANANNRRMQKNNTSGYPGVYFHKDANKYVAQIRVNGKTKHLGIFSTTREAAEAIGAEAIGYE